jgi:hypothetical protein
MQFMSNMNTSIKTKYFMAFKLWLGNGWNHNYPTFQMTVVHHITEHWNLQKYQCENLKSHIAWMMVSVIEQMV